MTTLARTRRAPAEAVRELDWLMLIVMALSCLGLVMAVSVLGAQSSEGPLEVVKRQGFKLLSGIIAFFVCAITPMRLLRRWAMPMFCVAVVACLLPHVMGGDTKGASRWIKLGSAQLQPVEFARFFMILAISWLLARAGNGVSTFRSGFLPSMGCAVALAAALASQPDNGNALLVLALAGCLALVAGVRFLYFAPLLGVGILGFSLLASQHDYVQRRVAQMWDASPDSQVGLGLIAVGSGGFFGRGLGQGWMKMNYVPEAHNDFVFAIIAEEFGFLGTLFVLGAYSAFGYLCYRLVVQVRDPFLRYAVCGYALMICLQASVNLLVVSGLAPAKGIDLPFVSTGGTSLLICLAAVGLIGNAVRTDRAGTFSTSDEAAVVS